MLEVSGVPRKNHDMSQVTDKLYHMRLYLVHLPLVVSELTTLVVIDIDYIGSYKLNYSKTCLNQTSMGLKNLFSLDRYSDYTGSNYI